MPSRRRSRKSRSSIIELDDSSSNGSQSTNNPKPTATITSKQPPNPIPAPVTVSISSSSDENDDHDDDESSTQSSSTSHRILTRRQLVEQLPVASRTKSAANKKGVPAMRLLSLDFTDGKRQGLSSRSQENMTKLSRLESKKKNSLKDEIHEVVEADMKDPELSRLLRKIAYCRVFTNYLFRQYDMLSIDFQLYSNLDDLMIDLKRRVGAYNAIRRSRLQILSGAASGGGGSSSSREGSTV